jgi:acid phosphatase
MPSHRPDPHARARTFAPRALKLGVVVTTSILGFALVLNVFATTAVVNVPAYAAPASRITVTGTGFASGQSGNLTFNGLAVATFKASSAGSFSSPLTIPATASMNTLARITAKTGSGAALATATLAIASRLNGPTLYLPAAAARGSTIRVGGAGFHAGQSGNLTFNGRVITTFSAAANGSFESLFVIPTTSPLGTERISAKTPGATLIATGTLSVALSTTSGAVPPPTATPTGTVASSPTAGPTAQGTAIPQPTPTPRPTATVTPAPTLTATPRPSTTPSPSASPTPTAPPVSTNVPNWSHVYVIYFENREYSSIIGSSSAPYINSLAAKYGLSTNFYAERHPSEPNYIALTSGGTQGITDDGVYNLGVNNLFKQVEASGRTWHEWQQGWPGNCFTGTSSASVVDGVGKAGAYVRKHNPAISYTAISGNAAECAKITNLASFNPGLANFNFITPNMINDMHDGTVADGDNWLKAFLPQILGSSAFANSVVFVTFDEGTTNVNGGGHIVTIPITPGMTPGYKQSATYNHYSMLRTIEQAWGLPYLGSASSAATMAFPW